MPGLPVRQTEIEESICHQGLAGSFVCLHSSLRSFGYVEEGAAAIVQGFLNCGCTLLVPSFSWSFAVPFPSGWRIPRNGWDYGVYRGSTAGVGRIYTPQSTEIDREMGRIPAEVTGRTSAVRGNHPLCSFSAVGPLAADLVADQRPDDVYAPLKALATRGGTIILAGVSLTKMSLLHLAEKEAGRNLFLRFANDADGDPVAVEAGGCPDGFENLAPFLAPIGAAFFVGNSRWQVFPAKIALEAAASAIRENPKLTHCSNASCERCNDAVAGGPSFAEIPDVVKTL